MIIATLALNLTSLSLTTLPVTQLQVPDGFRVTVFAHNIKNPRQLALAEDGTVFAGSRNAGNVYALVDENHDGVADRQYLVDHDLNMPSGIAYRDGALYVAAVNRLLRYDDITRHLGKPPEPVVVYDNLPSDRHHGWKAIEFDPAGNLFIPVGVPCNVCLNDDPRYGTILKYDLQRRAFSIYATGIRNSVGLAFSPVDQTLWFTDNGRDWLGDDLPPDELNHADRPGLDFGFPYLHGRTTLDPEYGAFAKPGHYTLPAAELGAHVAPLGLSFYRGRQFPEHYRNMLFIAEHGSWNRSTKSGYQVIAVTINGSRVTNIEPFVTGWLNREKDTAWGRPVDILNMPDGSLLISDDYADVIYRVSYERTGGKSGTTPGHNLGN